MNKEKLIQLKNEIVFVTTNKGKIASAKEKLQDIKIDICNYEVEEIRSDDVIEIAKHKVREAYKIVEKPCISLDAGFYIEALNGFPRAYVNFALDTIGIEGILKLMDKESNRKCTFKECLAYYDGENMLCFNGNHEGVLSETIKGNDNRKKWSDLWYVFIPYGYDKTLAEMTNEQRQNRKRCKENNSAMDEFADYYQKTKIMKKNIQK